MKINRAGYDKVDWVKALEAHKKPIDPANIDETKEQEMVENALSSTAQLAFNLNVDPETKNEALKRSSREIADQAAAQQRSAAVNDIKSKIVAKGIDPIALGVQVRDDQGKLRPITKEEWEGASDARWVEKVATQAALEYEKQVKRAWEQNALKPAQNLSSKFDPTTMKDGRIMSSTAAGEEVHCQKTNVPANAASIFDPFRLDRFAEQETEHDKGVREKKEAVKARENAKKAELAEVDPNAPEPMRNGQIVRSGAEDASVFNQRAPKNQVSMLDVHGTEELTPDQMKEKLAQLFTRVEDNGTKIREANEQRREHIQGKKEKDRSWEKVEKPKSTASLNEEVTKNLLPEELTKKLADLFTCPKKQDGQ